MQATLVLVHVAHVAHPDIPFTMETRMERVFPVATASAKVFARSSETIPVVTSVDPYQEQ